MASTEVKQLAILEKKKEMYFMKMQTIYELSKKASKDERRVYEFQIKARIMNKVREDFVEILDKINEVTFEIKEKFVPSYAEIEAFDEMYYVANDLFVLLESKREAKTANEARFSTNTGSGGYGFGAKLQPINLPKFSGAPEEWPTFHELFTKMVHDNIAYTEVEKVTHLVTHLEGSARSVCSSIPPTANNYPLIRQALIDRFEDKRALSASYLEKILNFKQLQTESEQGLENFLSCFVEPVKALKQMKLTDLADIIFLHLGLKKLDSHTSRMFENNNRSGPDIPKFDLLVKFVSEQVKILGRSNSSVSTGKQYSHSQYKNQSNLKSSQNINYALLAREPRAGSGVGHTSTSQKPKRPVSECSLCNSHDNHALYLCPSFKKLKVEDRWNYVKSKKLCFNCLSHLHMSSACQSVKNCQIQNCNKRHHSSLHNFPEYSAHIDSHSAATSAQATSAQATSALATSAADTSITPSGSLAIQSQSFCSTDVLHDLTIPSTVLLATVTVLARDSDGKIHELRGILDCGSQSHFVTHKTCRKLGLIMESKSSMVKGIGSSPLNVSSSTILNFFSRFDPEHCYVAHALVVKSLSERIPTAPVSLARLPHLKGLPLADMHFQKPQEVDLLIGAELWPLIVGTRKIVGPTNCPVALETTLGYVVMGRADIETTTRANSVCLFAQAQNQPSLDDLVRNFWELEEVPKRKILSVDDAKCEKFFIDTYIRNPDGTFTVRLPFRKSPDLLGSSKDSCIAKFVSLERRLVKNPLMQTLYANIIDDYIQNGIVSRLGHINEESVEGAYYLPHHGVYRPDHTTTPLRIVFNASSPTSSSYSLNDLMFVGPKLHADIFKILIHFRLYPFVLTSDIKRMFLQIHVDQRDRRYQRFIWRSGPNEPLRVHEVNKVVFGNTSSPYLANRVIRLLAELERSRYPLAAIVAERDIYVDDVVTSTESEEKLIVLYDQLQSMFTSGGFTLSKWKSNSQKLMSKIPGEPNISPAIDFNRDCWSKVLGVQWLPQKDAFSCAVDVNESSCTKRTILALTMSIFDPLGLVAPVTLIAKLILKELWKCDTDWDDTPPMEIAQNWKTFQNSLPLLNQLIVDRHVGLVEGAHTSLVGFADSSINAYGGCVYVRTYKIGHKPVVKLLCAKSKVAPKHVVTIPRLELCAALLLSNLMKSIIDSYESRHKFDSVLAFTDSKVTLCWIRSDPSRWKIFVGNRISQIHENLAPQHWYHILGDENPADVLSRGTTPENLLQHPLWWTGPSWLTENESSWPLTENDELNEIPDAEVKMISFVTTIPPENILSPLLDRISTFRKLLRATAYIFRACTRTNLRTPFVKNEELRKVRDFWIRYVQSQVYHDEISKLRKGLPITSNIRHLDPFLSEGVLRVGGRLQNAPSLSYDQKHPILLPSKGRFVDMVIDQNHIDLLHAGQQLVLSNLRQKYWIPQAITRIRTRIHRCNICFRTRPKPTIPKMAPLPGFRVEQSRVFDRTGVDYAGPFFVTPQRRRGQRILTKAYICLFVCLSVKAVHLELASDLSTECFLAAYKRFISRRGACSLLLSDGGTNFIGARRKLDELGVLITSTSFQAKVGGELATRGIEWKINPANGPWFGGIWESNVKSVKGHLQRFIGDQVLTYEEFNTVLIQIEAVMNSRPLCVLSNDPMSPTALTPSHFLTLGTSLENIPAMDVRDVPLNRLTRYQMMDRIVQNYWDRWHNEYLHTLQSRAKWTKNSTPINEGAVVVLMKDNVSPLHWPLGVIEKIYPGADGGVRVVTVRTRSGTYRRPVGKVCPLPTQ